MRRPVDCQSVAFGLLFVACGSSGASTPAAAPSATLQTPAAATQASVGSLLDPPLSDAMVQAQLLCTTTLSYRPCGMVVAADEMNCFIVCHTQILAGATNLMERAARDCASRPPEPEDAGSPSCQFSIESDSPVDPHALEAACNTRCRLLQADGGGATLP